MTTMEPGIYYDPYDFEIDSDPYPVWKRLRDEQPLYYNERYDFYALSRFDDVDPSHVWRQPRSWPGPQPAWVLGPRRGAPRPTRLRQTRLPSLPKPLLPKPLLPKRT